MTSADHPVAVTGDSGSSVSAARLESAAVMRRLGHAIVRHDVDDGALRELTTTVEELLARVESAPPRSRPVGNIERDLFLVAPAEGEARGNRFADCIVTGAANPMGVAAQMRREGDDAVLHCTLGDAFEGAPGRAHGGMVAALFDETMGFVLSIACTPAFTGRLTVTYRQPVPLGLPLEFRARLTSRDGRKLLIAGEAHHDGVLLAEAEALFVAVDPDHFTRGRS